MKFIEKDRLGKGNALLQFGVICFWILKEKNSKSITLTQYQIEGKDRLGSVSSGEILNQFKHMQQL